MTMTMTMNTRTVALCAAIAALSGSLVTAQDRTGYREYRLGSDLASIAKQTAVAPSAVTTLHQRPAILQELEWRPPYFLKDSTRQTDPVGKIVFSFLNDRLFRMVVDYDTLRTEGLTNADVIAALVATYGPPATSLPRRQASSDFAATPDTPIAHWVDADSSVTLFKVAYPTAFRLTVVSPKDEALARTAIAESKRLDLREAPQREAARQKKEAAEAGAALDKTRLANKAGFKP
jgi:hypothetical protein